MERHQIQLDTALLLSAIITHTAYKKRSLNLSGAFVGFIVMTIHVVANVRFAFMLGPFFFSPWALPKLKLGDSEERAIDAEYEEGSQRNWKQVLSSTITATILVAIIRRLKGQEYPCLDAEESILIKALVGGLIGNYCCCNGDTWSSELGLTSDEQPRMVTTFKRVHKGTNGAITQNGLLAAAEAGGMTGVLYVASMIIAPECLHAGQVPYKELLVIPLSSLAGVCGSLLDSYLGATVQYSGYCRVRRKVVGKPSPTVRKISGHDILSNNAVNIVSILTITVLTSLAFISIF